MNHKIIISINTFFLVLLVFLSLFFLKTQEDKIDKNIQTQEDFIEKTKEFIGETDTKIHNQTALIYKALNESFPIIIPEESMLEVSTMQEAVKSFRKELAFDKISQLEKRFSKYLSTTPPWIQEDQTEELLLLKYEIEFISILSYYEKDNDNLAIVVTLLKDLLDSDLSYFNTELDSQVEESYNNFNLLYSRKMEDVYESEIVKALNRSTLLLNKSPINVDESEISEVVNLLLAYSEDDRVQKKISMLDEFVTLKEINSLDKSFNDNYNLFTKSYEENGLWDIELYSSIHELALVLYEKDPVEYQDTYYEIVEYESLYNITKKAKLLNHQVKEITNEFNDNLEITLTMIKSQISTLKYELTTVLNQDVTSLVKIITDTEEKISDLEKSLQQRIIDNNNKLVKKYNVWILTLIKKGSSNNDNANVNKKLFPSNAEKETYNRSKISILKDLDQVDLAYAYLPISSLYNNLYSDVWNSINKDKQLEYAMISVSLTKRGITYFD
ncbi:MAG: hypothetical protein OCD02_03135 [Spirochaetaceae bacterium]